MKCGGEKTEDKSNQKEINSSMCILIRGSTQGKGKKRSCLPRSAASSNYLKCQRQDLPFPSS